MSQQSIRELDSLADRIKLHRQADKRGILVIEGSSDERFIQRLAPGRWTLFRAGTRGVVISTVEDAVKLDVERVAGLIDQDFDQVASDLYSRGLPIFWFDNADIEGYLFMTSALDAVVGELASEDKLEAYGGVDAVRKVAIPVALEVAAVRISNALSKWGLPFDDVDISKKLDRGGLLLKRRSYCQALAESCREDIDCDSVLAAMELRLAEASKKNRPFFRGKDALVVVGILLKSKIGSCRGDATTSDHLAKVLRLCAAIDLIRLPPFSEIASYIDAA